MGEPKKATSASTTSTGFSAKLVTITAITPDNQTAICADKAGIEVRVPMLIQRSKGLLPAVGETWIVSQDVTSGWTFSAIASTTDAPFVNPAVANPGTTIPGTAIEPGSIPGTALAPQSITGLNLAAAAAGTNLILDPAFTIVAINATRKVDSGTRGTWSLVAPNATASGAALATLALMPSALVPLYVTPGEQYYISVSITLSGGAGVTGGIQFAFNDGSFLGPDLPLTAGANTVAQLITIPAGVHSAYMRLIVAGLSGAATAVFTNPVLYITAGPNQLQAGSVTNAAIALGAVTADSLAVGSVTANAIAANAVDASKIVANSITAAQLQAGIVVSGIVDATVIEGAYFIAGTGGGTAWTAAAPTTPGYFMYYDDGVVSPVLVFAIAAAAGSDQWGNTWPGGAQFTGLATSTNLLTVKDTSGDVIATIDSQGNITGTTISATNLTAGGSDVQNDLISPLPLGIVNYGFKAIGGTAWPPAAISGETALFELDQECIAGRAYEFMMNQTMINSSGAGSQHIHLKFTTDGSTPTTSSPEAVAVASRVETGGTDAHIGPLSCIFGPYGSDTLLRCLVTGHAGAGNWQFKNDDYVRIMITDLGTQQLTNNLYVLGSGTSGGSSGQTYTKTYYATSTVTYFGSNASGAYSPYGRRGINGSCYQGMQTNTSALGDQYSFARFNYAQIASDLGAGTVNWIKVRLTSVDSRWSSGCRAIVGWTDYTGTYGDPFIPGGGTHFNTDNFWVGLGATVTHQCSGTLVSAITSGLTGLAFGRSADYSTASDGNNYGAWYGTGSIARCPAIILNYTK